MTDKLTIMLNLQNTMNLKVHPQWQTQGFKWTRAIMVEGVEALEHYGWKWWKKQEPDLAQVRIELVDIWHFILSHSIERFGGIELAYDHLSQAMAADAPLYLKEGDPRKSLEILIAAAAVGQIHMPAFFALMHQMGMSGGDLYKLYVAKNVLNIFRQDNGYKAGTYIKMWHDREDNVVLAEIMALAPQLTPEELMQRLGVLYKPVFHSTVVAA